jgi:hypothetical protein
MTVKISELLTQITKGQIRIPSFQRGFVWDADRVTFLMDSIYKEYPFGSLLLWQTKERLKVENNLGPFELPAAPDDYPVYYVLDGQQRLTSIFGVFQSELKPKEDQDWLNVYFDLQAATSPQDNQFAALRQEQADPERYFPLRSLFNTAQYGKLVRAIDDDAIAERIDKMRERFQTVLIPTQTTKTEDRATVAIIFERVNRQGVELNTFQLLTAWTWSEDFQLQNSFAELSADIAGFGFEEIGSDTNLLLRCCSAILTNDASPEALMGMNGEEVRKNFDRITNGIKYAIDFVQSNFKVAKLANLPFSTLLVPLAVFFAVSGEKEANYSEYQLKTLRKWFWRACFSRRYSSGVIRNLNNDISEVRKLRAGESHSLGDFPHDFDGFFFAYSGFGITSVNTKTFILMLASQDPLSFVSGAPVDLHAKLKDANRTEFHHLVPRAFVRKSGQPEMFLNSLSNFAFLSRADNRELGGVAPSEYAKKIKGDWREIKRRALIPESLEKDDLTGFVNERTELLTALAFKLCDVVDVSPSFPPLRRSVSFSSEVADTSEIAAR